MIQPIKLSGFFLLGSINMGERYFGAFAVLLHSGWINIVLSHGVVFTIGISERGAKMCYDTFHSKLKLIFRSSLANSFCEYGPCTAS